MALAVGTRLGVYEVRAVLGAGGMGEVYRATDTTLRRDVALKVLPDSFAADRDRVARLTREAQILASLNHPHIAGIHGLEASAGTRALVLELVEGETLADRIAAGPVGLEETIAIATQIASALQAAHEQGIVHRDLKPSNIKLRRDGTVKVLDFGLAKAVASGSSPTDAALSTITSPVATQAGVILGTAAYMSPEQAKGREADQRSDVWAFGCVMYEMLTGQRAFQGDGVAETLAAVLSRDPDWSRLGPDVPASIRTLIRRCLARDPRARVGDLAAPVFVLEEQAAFEGASSPPTHDRRRAWPGLIAAGIAGALLVAAATFFWDRDLLEPALVTRTAVLAGAPAVPVFDQTDRSFAVSPDGRRIVYVGNDRTQIFVRSLGALEARPIVTTPALVRGLFSSPDGQSIGYVDNNFTLRKVSITGGPPETVVTLDGPSRGASWGGGGVVFATAASGTGLQVVAPDGSGLKVLTRPNTSAGEADHVFPVWLPDGRGVLFTILPAAGGLESAKVALLDLSTGKWATIVNAGHDGRYVSGGYLAYAAGGALRAVKFDLDELVTTGAPIELLPRVPTANSGLAEFDVAADGSLVYLNVPASTGTLRTLVWVDRQGHETPLPFGPADYTHPRLSPDGTRLAVREGNDIFVHDLTQPTASPTRMTFFAGIDWYPNWTEDSRHLVFGSWEGGGFSNVYTQAIDGGPAVRLTTSGDMQLPTDVTRDGGIVLHAFSPQRPKSGGTFSLQLLTPGDSTPSHALFDSPFDARNGAVSPGGQWLAYEAEGAARPGQLNVYVRTFPDATARLIQVSTDGGMHAIWTRAGGELLYRGEDGTVTSVAVRSTKSSWSASTPVKLFRGPYLHRTGDLGRNYDVSSDGSRLLMIKLEAGAPDDLPPHFVVVQRWRDELTGKLP